MSTHLLIAAAYTEGLPQSSKLVLMAFADSADEHTLEAAPGLPKLRAWSGVSKQQVVKITTALTEAGYINRIAAGRLGRRAVYQVFPNGVPAIPHPDEVAARYATEQVIPNVENAQSCPQEEGPEGRTHAPHRGASDASRGAPGRPLQSLPSVSIGSTGQKSTGPRVDKPTPSASTASGFPGARAPAEPIDARLVRNPGPPCPNHPTEHVPCRRCAHEASKADPDSGVKAARNALRRTKYDTTTTEETRPA